MHAALAELRERVLQDRLPLMSLLQIEPLQMQSSHLSFQEFYAAKRGLRLRPAPPCFFFCMPL